MNFIQQIIGSNKFKLEILIHHDRRKIISESLNCDVKNILKSTYTCCLKISIIHLRELWYEEETENDNQEPRGPVCPQFPLDQVAGAGHSAGGAHLGKVDTSNVICIFVYAKWFFVSLLFSWFVPPALLSQRGGPPPPLLPGFQSREH